MSQWFRSRRSARRSAGRRARGGVFGRPSLSAAFPSLHFEALEQRRLLTVAATLAGTDLTVQITGADTAQIIESGGNVHVLDSTNTNQLATIISAATVTSITVTPDGISTDTVDLSGVGLGADFTSLQTVVVAAGSAGDTTLLAGSISTTGNQVYGDTVVLNGPTTLAADGIHFSAAVTAPTNAELTLSATQDIAFDAAVGSAAVPLGAITITNAHDVTAAASINAASLMQIAGSGTTTIGGALDTTAGAGVSINSATINLNAAIAAHDQPVSLVAATALSISTPQNLGATSATFTTDNLALSADLSGTGNLLLQPSVATDNVNLGGAGSGLSLANAALAHLLDGFASIIFGRADGTGVLTVQPGASSFSDPVILRMPGTGGALHVDGDLTGTGNASFMLDGSGGTTTLNANIVTAGAPIAIYDSVILGTPATITLDTTNGGAVAGGANIDIDTPGTIADDATASGLVLQAGTTGAITLAGGVGGTPIGSLTATAAAVNLKGGSVTTTNDQTYNGQVVLGANAVLTSNNGKLTFNGSVDAVLATVAGLETHAVTGGMFFNQPVGTGLNTTNTAGLAYLRAFGPTTLNMDGKLVASNDETFQQAVTLQSDAQLIAGSVTFAGTVDGAENLHITTATRTSFGDAVGAGVAGALTSLTIDGTGTTDLNGDTVKTSGDQTYNQAVRLTNDANLAGASVTFANTVDGGFALHVTSSGTTTFEKAVGGTSPALTNLTLDGAGTTDLNAGTINTSVDQTYNQAVRLTKDANLSGANVTFANTVDGGFALLVTTTGTITFEKAVGGTSPALTNLTLDGTGTTDLNGGTINTSIDQTYNQAVRLTKDANLSGANVTFANTVDGGFALHVTSSGTTTFEKAVGGTSPALTNLTLDGTGTTDLNGGAVNTSGDQIYGQAVQLTANADLSGANVTFANTVDGAFSLHVTTTGITKFENTVGVTLPGLASLTLDGTGTTDLNGDVIKTSGDQLYNQAVRLTKNADLSGANVAFANTIDGLFALHVTTTGTTTFENTVGVTLPGIASLTLDGTGTTDLNGDAINTSGDQLYGQTVSLTSKADLTGANVTFANTVDGAFDLHVTSTSTTKFEQAVGATLPSLTRLTLDGAGTTVLGGDTIKTTGDQLFNQAVRLIDNADLSGINVTFANTIDGAFALHVTTSGITTFENTVGVTLPGIASLLLDGTGTTDLNGDAINTSGNQTYNQAVSLTSKADLAGANITFAYTVDGNFALHATTTGVAKFEKAVGGGTPLASLTLDGTGTTDLNGDVVNTGGDQTYNQAVVLTSKADLSGANVTFANTVDGAFDLHVTTTGVTKFEQAVGDTLPSLTKLTLDGTGTTDLNGDIIKTSGDQLYNQSVRLTENADLSGVNVTFASTVDGAFALHVTTSGTTTFDNTVGVTLPGLANLTLDGTGKANLNGDAINTSGDQTYNQAVVLSNKADLKGTNVTFANTVDGGFALHVTTSGIAKFENTVGGASPVASLTLDGAGTTDLNGGAITTSGNQTYNQAVVLTSDATLKAANVAFNNTVEGDGLGPWSLTASAAGSVGFGDGTGYDAVGTVNPLKTLTVNGTTVFDIATSAANHPSVTTVGVQTYNGPVQLAADAVLLTQTDNSGIAFASTVDDVPLAHAALTADTTNDRTAASFGTVQFGGDVGTTQPLSAITVNTGGVNGAFVLNHAINTTGDVSITVFESLAGATNDNLTLNGSVASSGGKVLLRAGDNPTIAPGATIHAPGGSISLLGDYNNNDPTPGTTMKIDGLIVSPTVNIMSGDGSDAIALGGEIDATSLTVSSGAGNDTINVDGMITSPTVMIDAGSGDDTVILQGTTNSASVTVNAGDGSDTVNVQKTMPGTTAINTGAGTDTVNISSNAPSTGGTLTNITGLVAVHGDGADTLSVYDDGETGNVTGDLTSATINGLGMGTGATHGIQYDGGLKTVNVDLGSGSGLVFNVHSTPGVTDVNVTGTGVGAVNVGDNNQLAGIAGLLTVVKVHSLTLDDQNSGTGQNYDITGAAIGRPGVPPQVLVQYAQVAALALNTGDQTGGTLVDDTINLFLPRPGEAILPPLLQIDGGNSPGGFHNRLYVVAPQDATSHSTTYTAHVGNFGSADPIQVRNIQSLWMYGSPVDSNDFSNDTVDAAATGTSPAQSAVPSVIIGGANFDTLKGGGGQDVIFGGGTPASSSNPASLPGANPHVFPEQLSGAECRTSRPTNRTKTTSSPTSARPMPPTAQWATSKLTPTAT